MPFSFLSFTLVLFTYYRFGNVRTDFASIKTREDKHHDDKSREVRMVPCARPNGGISLRESGSADLGAYVRVMRS